MVSDEGGYETFLKEELEKLFVGLVQKHHAELGQPGRKSETITQQKPQVSLDLSSEPVSPPSRSASGLLSSASGFLSRSVGHVEPSVPAPAVPTARSYTSFSSWADSETNLKPGPIRNWATLTSRLMETVNDYSDSDDDQQMSYVKDILALRPPWKVALQHHALKREKSKTYSLSPLQKAHRMKDAEMDASCLQPFVRPPSSKLQIAWSLIGSLLIIWDLVTIPLELFDEQDMINFLVTVGRFSFVYWVLDMPLHVIFGVEIDGHLELRPRELTRRYFRSWFCIDVLVISIDAIILLLEALQAREPEGSPARSARYLRTLRLLRLLRLLRVAKLQEELTLLANNFLSHYAFMVMKVVSGLLMILAVNHIIACCWYGLGRWTLVEAGSSWLTNAGIEEEAFANSYAVSIHWALTQFTPATNNIAPANAAERFFAVWVILLAMGTFSSFISSITTTVSTLRASRAEQFQHHSYLVRFFNERNLSTDLYGKITENLKKQGMYEIRLKEKEVLLLQGVPERLKVVLHEEMFMSSLLSLGIWRNWSHEDDPLFCRQVCHQAMREHVASPGSDAFLPATECEEVYILEQGTMGYIARQLTSFESEAICAGEVLCLPCLWAEWLHRGRLTANGGMTAYYNGINCETFCSIIKQHGSPLWQYLQIYGILFIGEIEHMDSEDIFVTDKCLKQNKMDDIAARAKRFGEMVNSRHGTKNASFMATLGAVGHAHHHHQRSGTKETTNTENTADLPVRLHL